MPKEGVFKHIYVLIRKQNQRVVYVSKNIESLYMQWTESNLYEVYQCAGLIEQIT